MYVGMFRRNFPWKFNRSCCLQKIIRQGFKLIKALAGDDECKSYLITKGYPAVLRDAILANMVRSKWHWGVFKVITFYGTV